MRNNPCTRFFKHCHYFLPVLDSTMTMHQYLTMSPFLFWAIIAVGSRHYAQDPTILGRLTPKVMKMALESCLDPHSHISTIQGLLLICHWPFPMDTIYKDPSIMFSGIILQLAVQNGLHTIGKRLDFVRDPFVFDNEDQEPFRARLWIHCKAVCEKYVSSAQDSYQFGLNWCRRLTV